MIRFPHLNQTLQRWKITFHVWALKAAKKFADIGLEGFYLAEYAVYADDGTDGVESATSSSTSIRQRNIYFGLKVVWLCSSWF